jgi:Spy/CpxP family protein refolding chaperone
VTLVETRLAASLRRQWWKALLAVSLALNLFVIAGALWIRMHPPFPPPEGQIESMAGELDLNPPQKHAFERYAQTMRDRLEAMHKNLEPTIEAAWSEVASPRADEAQVMRLLDDASQQRRGFVRDMTTTTLSFLSTLSPQQRAKFVELVLRRHHRPWDPQHHGPH